MLKSDEVPSGKLQAFMHLLIHQLAVGAVWLSLVWLSPAIIFLFLQ